jgi:D-methionine transport system permease protein
MTTENFYLLGKLLPFAVLETLYMIFAAGIIAVAIGAPIGVVLSITSKGHIKEHNTIYKILSTAVNIGRSFPFAILIIVLIPLTRWVVGTSIGTTAAIVPLSIAAIPFFARLIEQSISEVDNHIIEASTMMGATTLQIVTKVLLREPLPSIINNFFTMMISLVGYSAMAGLVGGGGLGKVAIQYGYNRFNIFIMAFTVFFLIMIVEALQFASLAITKKIIKKRGLHFHE